MSSNGALGTRQFAEAWRTMCAAAPGTEIDSAAGVDYVFSGLPIPFFNVAVMTKPNPSGEELRASGERACAWAAVRAVPWLFVVTHDGAPGWEAALEGCGLARLMSLTGMEARDVEPVVSLPAGLEVHVAADDACCEAMIDVNAAAYAMSFDAAKPVWGRHPFWKEHCGVLGTAAGEPVSCAGVMMVDGYRYVFLVATMPGQQRRGYADAVMRRALTVARERHGDAPTFLHATEAGQPVYERMGYQPTSLHTLFIEKKFLGGHEA